MAIADLYSAHKKSPHKTAGSGLDRINKVATNTVKTEPFDLGTAYDNNLKMKYRQQGIDALKPPEPFKMDLASIQSDPTYQAAMQSAKEATQVAEGDISAAMNRRGIMNSTINANAASNAAQAEYGRVNRELLPGLIEDQYKRYVDSANMNRQHASDLFGVSDMYSNDEQTAFNNSVTEAGLTGNYLSPEARGIANQIVKLGEAWKTGTPEQKDIYHEQANQLRARLSGLGVDPSLFGANISTEGRMANIGKAGVRTLAGEAQDYNQVADTMDRTFNQGITMADLTGTLPNGQKTTAEQQRQLSNLWTAASQTGTIPDALADMYGIPRGTKTQNAIAQAESIAQGWAGQALNREEFEDRSAQGWAGLDFDMANADTKAADSTFTPSQVRSDIEQRFPQFFKPDDYGEIAKPTATDLESMYQSVIGYGLDEAAENDILRSIGLNDKQIADLDKKFLSPGN
ncbi:hypothetical protein [Paenibacillus harenae]|uniref:hypothetical protein n=1 Tax=Paenibacillus harenae TaxID=306543 RepID=UPI0027916486|nr:hypothetical protein [Paenibacillus harenae]MDQ0062391.1 hypothetical protein [Paenibacillus harenae]